MSALVFVGVGFGGDVGEEAGEQGAVDRIEFRVFGSAEARRLKKCG